jgi:hypothetical protein
MKERTEDLAHGLSNPNKNYQHSTVLLYETIYSEHNVKGLQSMKIRSDYLTIEKTGRLHFGPEKH